MGVIVSDTEFIDNHSEFYVYQKDYKPLTLINFVEVGTGPLKKYGFYLDKKTRNA